MEYTCVKPAISMKEKCINLNSIKSVMINTFMSVCSLNFEYRYLEYFIAMTTIF